MQLPVAENDAMVQLTPAGEELTVTDPVGVPVPGAMGATVTVTVAGRPMSVGDGDTVVIVVVVLAFAMFQEPFTSVMA
jgi:hypothetical protein